MLKRQSNFELLRLVAIAFVMIVHANFGSLGAVNRAEIVGDPAWATLRTFVQQSCSVCVNVFILISGYFGIRPKLKSCVNLVSQIVLWQFILGIISSVYDGGGALCKWFSLFGNAFNLSGNWFVRDYLRLLLIAPFLNAFCDASSDMKLLRAIGVYYLIVVLFDHVIPLRVWGLFNGGYSVYAFIGLYLVGRYIARNTNLITRVSTRCYAIGYFSSTFAATAIYVVGAILCGQSYIMERIDYLVHQYTSPFVLCASICFFMCFARLNIVSGVINWMATSVFAVFIAHCGGYYIETIRHISAQHGHIVSSILIAGFMFAIAMSVILVDKIRYLIVEFLFKTRSQKR